jgi:DNA-binding protein H-NS
MLDSPESRKRSMAKTYADLNREIDALKAKAEVIRQKEKTGVLKRIREAIAIYGLTAEELGFVQNGVVSTVSGAKKEKVSEPESKSATAPSVTVASTIKYRDASGNWWGGRGPKPGWLKAAIAKGRSIESFAAAESANAQSPALPANDANNKAKSGAKKVTAAKETFKSVAKFRDDVGHTWSGRGPKPAWFTAAIESGKTVEQLTV